jgi:hypothetical protein
MQTGFSFLKDTIFINAIPTLVCVRLQADTGPLRLPI